jgi:alpha-1,2-mannosyltransferase
MSLIARAAWMGWIIFFLVISVIVGLTIGSRTVTPAYRSASNLWFAGEALYTGGIHGFLYLPHAALLFAPFANLPFSMGEILWRAFGLWMLAAAVWKLSRLQDGELADASFLVMTLLTIPMAMSSARNGQMNILLAALMAFAAIAIAKRHWSAGAIWLTLGLALKPLMISMFLLAAVLYRPLLGRLAAAFLLLLLFPFLLQEPTYVWNQYVHFFHKALAAGSPWEVETFSDIYGIVTTLGLQMSPMVQLAVRGGAALLTLLLCRLGLKRWGHEGGTILLLSFSACYMLLFNPRTENNTYALLGLPLAFFAASALLVNRWFLITGFLVALTVFMSASHEITRGHNYWLSPTSCLLFLLYLTALLARSRPPGNLVHTFGTSRDRLSATPFSG